MSLQLPRQTGVPIFKEGYRLAQGVDDAVLRNIAAILELCNITRTSLGPNGRNKIVVNHLEKIFLTQDSATIIDELDVYHPAAKLVAMAAQQQAREFGDGTNIVLTLTGEFLKKAENLIRLGLHTHEIIKGYEQALQETMKHFLPSIALGKDTTSAETLKRENLTPILRSIVSSKQLEYANFIAKLIAEAADLVMPEDIKKFNVDNIRVVKVLGKGLEYSTVVRGLVLPREPESKLQNFKNAKVAVFLCPLDVSRTETKGTVLLNSAKDMLDFSLGEEKQIEASIKEIYNVGVRVIITGQAIGELARHYIDKYGMVALRVTSKFDLQRVCRIMDATPLARLGAPMPEEMGSLDIFETIELGGNRVTILRQESTRTRTATILLRGNTKSFLDDVERAIDNGVSSIKSLIRDHKLLPGAGATELALSERLLKFSHVQSGANQHAIRAFAEAFEVIPLTLAENSGLNSTQIITQLHAAHHLGDVSLDDIKEGICCRAGIVIDDSDQFLATSSDNHEIDLYNTKESAISLAADTAITILQIDQVVMARAAGGPKLPNGPPGGGHWDDD